MGNGKSEEHGESETEMPGGKRRDARAGFSP